MAFYRGMSGYISLGGQLQGSPLVNGALTAGAATMNIDATTLIGSVAVGDTFTLAGESGSPTHTVTNGPFYLASSNAITGITFTPAIASGGVVDNAAVTFTSNAVSQVTNWSLNTELEELETTVMGDAWKTVVGGQASWRGSIGFRLDLGDTRQAALAAKILATTPTATVAALTLGVLRSSTGPAIKQLYGAAILRNIQITAQMGQIVNASAEFTGNGYVLNQWV